MSGPGVGFEYPPVEVSWLKRDALLFANTIGATADELHFLYVSIIPVHMLATLPAWLLTVWFLGAASRLCSLPNLPHHLA